jgi:hypothetical protein
MRRLTHLRRLGLPFKRALCIFDFFLSVHPRACQSGDGKAALILFQKLGYFSEFPT